MIKPAVEALAVEYKTDILVNDLRKNKNETYSLLRQCTIKQSIEAVGIGKYSGEPVVLTLHPAPINTGIIFKRIDLKPIVLLAVEAEAIKANAMQTSLVKNTVAIHGVEHLLSALVGLGIDNLYIELDNAELPKMDESAEPFVFLIQAAGIKQQSALKQFICLKQKIQFVTSTAWIVAEPSMFCKMTSILPAIPNRSASQKYSIILSNAMYVKSLSRARHDTDRIPFKKWRYRDECIRHHVLDTLGDFYTLGHTILGSFTSYNTNHIINQLFTRYLFSNPQFWELITYQPLQQETVESIYY